jgi:hypothetical protein
MYEVGPRVLARAAGAGLAAALAGGLVLHFLPNFGLIMLLLLGAVYGYVVAAAVSVASNRKRGALLGWVAVLAVFLGFSLSRAALAYLQLGGVPEPVRLSRALATGFGPDLGSLAVLAVAALMVYTRLR